MIVQYSFAFQPISAQSIIRDGDLSFSGISVRLLFSKETAAEVYAR
jgi:hypothetical protein